jgi:hypothetical protein
VGDEVGRSVGEAVGILVGRVVTGLLVGRWVIGLEVGLVVRGLVGFGVDDDDDDSIVVVPSCRKYFISCPPNVKLPPSIPSLEEDMEGAPIVVVCFQCAEIISPAPNINSAALKAREAKDKAILIDFTLMLSVMVLQWTFDTFL